MTIQRENVLRGPGTVTLGAVQFFDKAGINADLVPETFDIEASAYGLLDTRRKDIQGKIDFTPSGRLTAAILAALYPHGTPSIGASLFGATDTATITHAMAGTKITWHSTALTRMPSLKLSSLATAMSGAAEITALRKNNTAPTADASFYTVASEQWAGAYDVADLKGGVYTGVWGTGGTAVTFVTEGGWDVEFDMAVAPQYAEGVGTYDVMLNGVTIRAKCVPLGISETTLLGYLNAQGSSCVLGGSMRSSKDLVISCATGLTVTIREAVLVRGPLKWGRNELRIGEIGFVGHRLITGGVPAQLFSVALSA